MPIGIYKHKSPSEKVKKMISKSLLNKKKSEITRERMSMGHSGIKVTLLEKKKQKRDRLRMLKYGLTDEQFNTLSLQQQNRCAVCKLEKKLEVDHCHKTQKIRGLLCGDCNRGLGMFRDDLIFIQNALTYLKVDCKS